MPRIYGPFSIQSDESGSLGTTNDITFFFNSSSYNDPTVSGSLAIIKASTLEETHLGARGKLEFILSTTGNSITSSGIPIMRLFHTGSNNEPRVGIGFESAEKIEKTFEIKSKKDSAEGTELVLEGSRTSVGAQIGDSAGSINFVINSASFDSQFSSGSIVNIDSEVTAISSTGAQGHLLIGASKSSIAAPTPFWRLGYGADPVHIGNLGAITTGSLNIVRPSLSQTQQITLTHVDGSSIGLQYVTSSVASNNATVLDAFNFINSGHNGVIYDYTLFGGGNQNRTGQIMVIMNASGVEMTDVSSPNIGSGDIPLFSATVVNGDTLNLKITNGFGSKFKAFVKKL